jgi:two-component system, LytTR family, response regulator
MNALIVDDEPVARAILREALEEAGGVTIVGEASNGEQALAQIRDLEPEVVFLDVQMPAPGGFGIIENLRGRIPSVVFVTAYEEYALRAFEAGAIDYLLKPVRPERLREALARVKRSRFDGRQPAEQVARVLEAISPGEPRKLVGKAGSEYFLLDLSDVIALTADGELVWIHTRQKRYLAGEPLVKIEQRLRGRPFLRIHRNALVNLDHVRKLSALSSQRWQVTLSNQQELVVSKRQSHKIRGVLKT